MSWRDAEGQVLATAEGLGTVQLAANGHYAVDAGNARPLHPARDRHRQRHRRHGRAAHWHPHNSGKQQDRSAAERSAPHDEGPAASTMTWAFSVAADHAAAERRRIRLMKESGFDAIRAAHNPLARRSWTPAMSWVCWLWRKPLTSGLWAAPALACTSPLSSAGKKTLRI